MALIKLKLKILGGGEVIPFGALAFYDFKALSPASAILEQVNKQSSLITQRLSNVNAEQIDGSIKTFLPGFAALIPGLGSGTGDLIQGSQQNRCLNLNFKPVDLTNTTQSGPGSFSVGSTYSHLLSGFDPSNGNSYIIDNNGQVADSFINFGGVAGNTNTHSLSIRVHVVSGSAIVKRLSTSAGEVTVNANSSFERITIDGFAADAADQVRVVATPGSVIAIMANQLEEAANSSSEIEIVINGAPATRLADDSTITTLLEKGLLLDKDGNGGVVCNAADRNDGGFIGGINTASKLLSFIGDTSPLNGKYFSLLKSLWNGATAFADNGAIISLSFLGSLDTAGYISIKGTDSEIQAGFEFLNAFTIDFSTSGYFTDQAQLAIDRAAAGDTLLASLPAVELWPVNNFRISFNVNSRAVGIANAFNALFGAGTSNSDRLLIETNTDGTRFVLNDNVGGSGGNISLLISDFESDPIWSVEILKSSTLGLTFTINGSTVNNPSLTSDSAIGLSPTATIGGSNFNSGRIWNGVYQDFLMEPLT